MHYSKSHNMKKMMWAKLAEVINDHFVRSDSTTDRKQMEVVGAPLQKTEIKKTRHGTLMPDANMRSK